MILAAVQVGDIVLADRMGRRFYAVFTGREQRELRVEPIDRRVTYHQVKAREVLDIWHKRRRRKGNAPHLHRSVSFDLINRCSAARAA
jgi:hypothetical protein